MVRDTGFEYAIITREKDKKKSLGVSMGV